MNVILLTVFVGLILVGLAITFFFYARSSANGSSPERDSLLPLQDEKTVIHQSKGQATENGQASKSSSEKTRP